MASTNKSLNATQYDKSRQQYRDEWYTQLEDIKEEVRRYHGQLKGKTVYCNCDDPTQSKFVTYFVDNFKKIGLKKLISTGYGIGPLTEKGKGEKLIYEGEGFQDYSHLEGDGSFDSDECMELLKECDVVITNPPFSKFREFLALLIKHKKEFLIIGNLNAVTYKDVFPLIKSGELRLGYLRTRKLWFRIHDEMQVSTNEVKVGTRNERYVSIGTACWFTNLAVDDPKKVVPTTEFNKDIFKTYDGTDIVDVPNVRSIPLDYYGVMGVPIGYMKRHNDELFDIVGYASSGVKSNENDWFEPQIDGKVKFKRILIKRKVH